LRGDLGLARNANGYDVPFIEFLLVFSLIVPLTEFFHAEDGAEKMCIVSGELCEIGWFAASFTSSPWELEFKKSTR
jgi:hypothetical protein